jgi:hypothetical protein
LLLAVLSISLTGCAECVLDSMVSLWPKAYSGGGTTVDEKVNDVNQSLESARSLEQSQ